MKKHQMKDSRTPRVAQLKPGQYADGSPLDDLQYLECKLILKTDEFTSPKGFKKYGKPVARADATPSASMPDIRHGKHMKNFKTTDPRTTRVTDLKPRQYRGASPPDRGVAAGQGPAAAGAGPRQ